MKYSIICLCLFLYSSIGFSQRLNTPALSPASKISQVVGLSELTLEYARPSAKERVIFGELVPFGKMWRTGANASTKITLNDAAHIAGNPIEAGTYAIYTIPGKETWTIIIHSNTKMRSIAGDAYKPENDVFRFEVASQQSDTYVETFTLQFSDVKSNSCNIQLTWENTAVNIPVAFNVDQKIEEQLKEFMENPESIPHRTYFEAAQYYINNDKSKVEAINFIDAALDKSPNNFRYGLLKAKIQDKAGDRVAALKTVTEANNWAIKSENSNYIEQTAIFKKYLEDK